MNDSDPTQQAGNIASAAKTIVDLASSNPEFKEAGSNLARSARKITALVDNCLLPIAIVNYAFEKGRAYFEERFQQDLEEVTASIPPERIVEPKASIAAPILQGLTFAHEEPDLKSLFLHLLKSSMDTETAQETHPAFVEVIKQLSAEEAKLILGTLSAATTIPVVNITAKLPDESGRALIETNVVAAHNKDTKVPVILPGVGLMLDNWVRLGLINITFAEHLTREKAYDWAEERPEYVEAVKKYADHKIEIQKGIIRVTNFGKQFLKLVA